MNQLELAHKLITSLHQHKYLLIEVINFLQKAAGQPSVRQAPHTSELAN